jgi:hypothetical protein
VKSENATITSRPIAPPQNRKSDVAYPRMTALKATKPKVRRGVTILTAALVPVVLGGAAEVPVPDKLGVT